MLPWGEGVAVSAVAEQGGVVPRLFPPDERDVLGGRHGAEVLAPLGLPPLAATGLRWGAGGWSLQPRPSSRRHCGVRPTQREGMWHGSRVWAGEALARSSHTATCRPKSSPRPCLAAFLEAAAMRLAAEELRGQSTRVLGTRMSSQPWQGERGAGDVEAGQEGWEAANLGKRCGSHEAIAVRHPFHLDQLLGETAALGLQPGA